MKRIALYNLMLPCICLFLVACSPSAQNQRALPEELRVGVVPVQDPEQLRETMALFADYLADRLDVKIDLVVPDSYGAVVQAFAEGRVDLALLGGAGFVQAQRRYGAVPLVSRAVDQRHTSYILVPAASPAQTLSDLEGVRFAFGSEASTSGHYMPRYFLEEEGMIAEQAFSSVQYTGAHDRTVALVTEATVDAGAASAVIVDQMFRRGHLNANRIRVLWESPPYVNYTWALQPGFHEEVMIEIQDAFLSLSRSKPGDADILDSVDAEYYLPASAQEFVRLEQALSSYL